MHGKIILYAVIFTSGNASAGIFSPGLCFAFQEGCRLLWKEFVGGQQEIIPLNGLKDFVLVI